MVGTIVIRIIGSLNLGLIAMNLRDLHNVPILIYHNPSPFGEQGTGEWNHAITFTIIIKVFVAFGNRNVHSLVLT